jgi:transcriptional regulator with GAF, ATPase, and Fis domain
LEEHAMRLVADRFVVRHEASAGFAHDLATRQFVWLDVADAGDAAAQRVWLRRCDELFRLRHPALAPLVDYGSLGQAHRFEAWSAAGRWRGSAGQATLVANRARAFLRRIGLSAGDCANRVFDLRGVAAVVPASDAGYATSADSADFGEAPGVALGIVLVDRPGVAALREIVRNVDDRRPRIACLWGCSGSGVSTALLTMAREARLNALIPIDVQDLHTHAPLVAGRSVFVIDRSPAVHLTTLVQAALAATAAHVHLIAGGVERRGIDSVPLGTIAVDDLVSAVRPAAADAKAKDRLRRAAERASGLPGRFARSLWAQPVDVRRRMSVPTSRVAEPVACYRNSGAAGGAGSPDLVVEPTDTPGEGGWAAPGELAALRRRLEHANALLATGRHAPGLRLLRQSTAALARRGAWTSAVQGALTTAIELLKRGRPRDAIRVLDDAQEYAGRSGDSRQLLEIAALMGECRLDLGKLDEAERLLTAARAAARAAADRWRAFTIATSLARCLFWRGEYADAAAALEADGADVTSPAESVRRLRVAAGIALALADPARALASVAEARTQAADGDGRLRADIEHTSAFIKLRIGDFEGAAADAAVSLAQARVARHPIRALCARLLLAEADRRRGVPRDEDRLAALRRLAAAAPPLVKARCDLIAALADGTGDRAAVARQMAATGLKALELFGLSTGLDASAPAERLVADAVGILHVCQHADDEAVVLKEVCARIRRQLHAAAAAFVGRTATACDLVAADGARIETQVAQRSMEAGLTIGPHRAHEFVEAAAPVQFGGEMLGALCVRWTIGSTHDRTHAAGVLSMAAAAAAPVLSAVLLRRAHTGQPVASELIGVTAPIAELRRAIASAAAAPFAVLIEGESGSGKELVARAIHKGSPRRDRAFCTLNCAALPDDLVESELFGHARGAFTGAVTDRAGVFEEAHAGTLFLDEIGELSPRAQAKLLRVLQEGELRRIGENIARRIDVRVVAATNRDLRREVEAGRFRQDLLYRVDVVRIAVPPLRERREDVAALVDHYWADAARRTGSHAALAAATRAALARYDWPGNVRELQNVLAALAVRSPKRGVVPPTALPPHIAPRAPGSPGGNVRQAEACRLDAARRTFEEGFVRAALVRAGGHRGRAADELGVTRQGLTKLMSRLGIE